MSIEAPQNSAADESIRHRPRVAALHLTVCLCASLHAWMPMFPLIKVSRRLKTLLHLTVGCSPQLLSTPLNSSVCTSPLTAGVAAGGRGRGGAGGTELLHSHIVRLAVSACASFTPTTPITSVPNPRHLYRFQERRLEEEGGVVQGVRSYYTPTSSDSLVLACYHPSHLSLYPPFPPPQRLPLVPLPSLQERRLEEEGGAVEGIKSYYTPTSSDSFISAFRSWLRRFAGGKARFPAYVDPKLPPAKSRREILDRQCFHVRLCPDCQRVQRWSDRLRIALWAATLLLLAATALFPLAPPAIKNAVGPAGAVFAAAAAVVCAAAAHWLKGFIERNYVYEDFVHALWYPAKKSA
ncbi:unnamed protein product [Closterium sp. Naga37s-1]|nr:unnamed protein product [Closterium sp. Naga37s-1]